MELTFAMCESIVATLPIGYYTSRRIPVEVSRDAETSYYSPMEDKIIISYPIIAHRMNAMPEGSCDEEEAVRSMMYHEVSHAILTPSQMSPDTPTNIFEDERIESVLRNYYHGVNFRKQLYDMHGGKVPKATNRDTAFFNAVRFGLGTAKVQQEVNRMLKKYKTLNRNTNMYTSDRIDISHYKDDIYELYRLVSKEFAKDPDAFQQQGNDGEQGEGQQKQMDSLGQGGNGDKQKQESQNGQGKEKEQGEGKGEESEQGEVMKNSDSEHELELTNDEMKRMVGAGLCKEPNLEKFEREQLNEFQKTVETIIGNFNKKNSGGAGINTYSGVFNPRAVVRKDYRFFERSMSVQGNNRFGTCHLNLIIDCSGSFSRNVPLVNGILAVLSEVERKNRNFSMDVAFINHRFKICQNVRDRQMRAWGSNAIPSNMKEIMLSLQKPQTCNYNIVLFDGDAICEDYHNAKENCRRFGAFDMKQTTLITDPDNEQYMNPTFNSAKVIITKDYTKELIKHITNALTIAFG